jgi:hypothetical protein
MPEWHATVDAGVGERQWSMLGENLPGRFEQVEDVGHPVENPIEHASAKFLRQAHVPREVGRDATASRERCDAESHLGEPIDTSRSLAPSDRVFWHSGGHDDVGHCCTLPGMTQPMPARRAGHSRGAVVRHTGQNALTTGYGPAVARRDRSKSRMAHAAPGASCRECGMPTRRAAAKAEATAMVDLESRLAPFFPPLVADLVATAADEPTPENRV